MLHKFHTVKHSAQLHKLKVSLLVNLVDVDNMDMFGLNSLQMKKVKDLSSLMVSSEGLYLVNISLLLKLVFKMLFKEVYLLGTH